MKIKPQCIPCYFTQSINAMVKGNISEDDQLRVLNLLMPLVQNFKHDLSPAENSSLVLHELSNHFKGRDLFLDAKRKSNEQALSMLPLLEKELAASEDPLWFAIQVSVAGNVVDLGILEGYDLEASLKEVFSKDFGHNDYSSFKKALEKSKSVLILGDNSGEIAFDTLLVKSLQALGKEVTYSVKGGPVLNDATIEDAKQVGMDNLCRVITTGNNFLGVVEKGLSSEFQNSLQNSDLIISKGQANYETISEIETFRTKTYFLLKAKCELVGEELGVKFGDLTFQLYN